MLLDVKVAELVVPTTTFSFVVPGDRVWSVRSVVAVASRAVGGAPNRAYQLAITDGTSQVVAVGADDNGTEPGTCTVTWCAAQAATVASGNVGVTVAPLPPLVLRPGYVCTGTILGAAGADSWLSAVVWYTYQPSAG